MKFIYVFPIVNRLFLRSASIFALVNLTNCSFVFAKDAVSEDRTKSDCNQVYIIEKYAADHFPDFDPTSMDINISSYDSTWEASYVPKLDMFDAHDVEFKFPTLVIDKLTCSIVEVRQRR